MVSVLASCNDKLLRLWRMSTDWDLADMQGRSLECSCLLYGAKFIGWKYPKKMLFEIEKAFIANEPTHGLTGSPDKSDFLLTTGCRTPQKYSSWKESLLLNSLCLSVNDMLCSIVMATELLRLLYRCGMITRTCSGNKFCPRSSGSRFKSKC